MAPIKLYLLLLVAYFRTQSKEVGYGLSDGRLYYLWPLQHGLSSTSLGVSSTALEWHLRLGHPNLNKLRLMVPSLTTVSKIRCEFCELSKHTFELVHSDVWGPFAFPNHAQVKYYVLFIDDYSQMSWIYLMKEKK